MCFKAVLKRVFPFFATFALGLLIASFFVSVAAPNFQFRRGFSRHREMDRQMRQENQELRDENYRLKQRLAELEATKEKLIYPEVPLPPPPPTMTMPTKTIPYKSR